MKSSQVLCIALLSFIVFSCNSNKSNKDKLYNTTWELEYISGPRIAFKGLFPKKKPQITFNEASKKVTGNNSCNAYSAPFKLEEETVSFGEPGITTMMYCGEGEKVFLNTMKKINKYRFDDDGNLNLMVDDIPMMRFHKVQ